MTRYRLLLVILFISVLGHAQIIVDDTVCINRPIQIATRLEADRYQWNFCTGNLRSIPQGQVLDKIAGLDKPAFISCVQHESQWFAVVSNHVNAHVLLLSFGSSLRNTPQVTDLGTFGDVIPKHTQGVQLLQVKGVWYCFVAGGQKENSGVVRLRFGTSLTNVPSVSEFHDKDLDYPIDLAIVEQNGAWYGFTTSFNTNRVFRLSFGSSLDNVPKIESIAANLGSPCGIASFTEDGQSFLYVTNYSTATISRLSFGGSWQNAAQISNFSNKTQLQFPFDMVLTRDCEHLFGFVLNRFGSVVRAEFKTPSDVPEFKELGSAPYLFNPQGISDVIRVGDTLYAFVANIDNSSIARMQFPVCDYASPASSTQKQAPPVYFSKLGEVNIRLETQKGSQNAAACRNIQIVENPEISLNKEVLLLPGEKVSLDAGSGYTSYQWSTGDKTQSTTVDRFDWYKVTVSNRYGCTAVDSIEVKYAGIPSVITPNGDGLNDTWEMRLIALFSSVRVQIFDRHGNEIISYDATKHVWDGNDKNGKPVRPDTYWYVVELGDGNRKQTGQLSVIRD